MTKVVGICLGLTMAVGVGFTVASNREAIPAHASTASVSFIVSGYSYDENVATLSGNASSKSGTNFWGMYEGASLTSNSSYNIDTTTATSISLHARKYGTVTGGKAVMTFNILDASTSEVLATSSLEPTSTTPTAGYSGTIAAFAQGTNKAVKFQLLSASNSSDGAFCGMTEASFTYTEGSSATSYSISTSVSNGTYSGATQIQQGKTAVVTISPNTGYKLPTTVSVSGATSTYNSSTGEIELSEPTGDVNISASMVVATQYTVSTSLTGLTASGDSTIYENGTATVTLSVIDSSTKVLPTELTSVTNAVSYSYNSSTGAVTINGATGNIVITASAINKPSEETESFTFPSDKAGWTEVTASKKYSSTDNLITLTWESNTGADISYWNPARIYNYHTMTISAVTGAGAVNTIKQVIITANSSTYATNTNSNNVTKTVSLPSENPGTLSSSVNDKVVTITASGTVTEIVLTCGSTQVRWDRVQVVYEKDQSEVPLQSISATCNSVLVSQQVKPLITFTPSSASNKNVTYQIVENTNSFASVASDGTVTGLGEGTARLKITPEDKNASAITIDVTVNSLPTIHGIEIGKSYAMTGVNSNNYELTGIYEGATHDKDYGIATTYSSTPENSFPVRAVNGLYARTVALQVSINSETKYLSYDVVANGNSLNYVSDIDRESSWVFAEEDSELVIRNVANYTKVLCFNGGTTNRFSCYSEATASGTDYLAPTFVEIAEQKTDKEYVQDFVDLYMHMTDYDQGGTQGSTGGSGWCKDQQHGYYLTAKAGYNQLIHGISAREDLWSGDSDFAAAKTRYEEWARINNDANPYDGYDSVHTPIQSPKVFGGVLDNSSNATTIIIIVSMVSLTAIAGYAILRKRKEQ